MILTTLADVEALREADDIECKLAQGRDGTGEVPKSMWETYSAFANSSGGYIILGLEERSDGSFTIDKGIVNKSKVIADLYTTANNSQKVSHCLIDNESVQDIDIDGKNIIIIKVPRASRQQRPVYVGGNPLTGTYIRQNEGDCACPRERIRRMIAEQISDSNDDRILVGYGIDDLHWPSVLVFRNLMQTRSPSHPFLEGDPIDLLHKIKAFRKDRETGQSGLTVAGLLMFGTSESIRDEFPNFALDYQEREDPKVGRWTDRLTTDGSWPGNLLEFFRLVWRRLTADLKVPFQMVGGQRVDETPIHVALREALVNTLVHADYTCRASVLVVKRPDMFGFRNPGDMRVPVETAILGGESDSRNRVLQQMFLMIGAGERAGSGVPKMFKGWREQHWRPPVLIEKKEPSEQTILQLRMEDLLPPEAIEFLRIQFGEAVDNLSSEERVVLATAVVEQTVSHARAMALCDLHPADMTALLRRLVQDGLLTRVGQGRGSLYHLSCMSLPDPDVAFSTSSIDRPLAAKRQSLDLKPEPLDLSTISLDQRPPAPMTKERQQAAPVQTRIPYLGRWIEGLDRPLVDDLTLLDHDALTNLRAIASGISRGRMQTAKVDEVLTELCHGKYLSIKVLASLIGRAETYLRQNYLNRLVTAGVLVRAFPSKPNDPRQAYTTGSETVMESKGPANDNLTDL
ncbi:RNA-binding domain-containing protein [uncultured Sphingomonas sp.]|uniref:RNA-binding domain-containing protein n=1 Tax=uncultured Sphingomonas sp. TaxID=158754 RepID=UPI0025D41F35|nr:RNA-binding domain-containing protein [uncultured Sphingomonas sp.]